MVAIHIAVWTALVFSGVGLFTAGVRQEYGHMLLYAIIFLLLLIAVSAWSWL